MVAACDDAVDARLLPRGGHERQSLLALSRWALSARDGQSPLVSARGVRMSLYAEIGVTTNFSFLRGASHPKEFAHAAALLGYAAIGIADRNTLAGVVRMYSAFEELKEKGEPITKQLVGCRLVFVDGTPDILAYPTDRQAYGHLCRLLSAGKLRAPKGDCILTLEDLLKWQEGLLLVVMPPHPSRTLLKADLPKRFWNKDLALKDEGVGGVSPEIYKTNTQCGFDEMQ